MPAFVERENATAVHLTASYSYHVAWKSDGSQGFDQHQVQVNPFKGLQDFLF